MSEVQSIVEYRDIQGFPGYRVGSDGSVWSAWLHKSRGVGLGVDSWISNSWWLLKVQHIRGGLLAVYLRRDGRVHQRQIGRLVLEEFVGPRPEGMECCHNDGNPERNVPENLRWDTHAENMRDRDRHGTTARGSKCGTAKITEEQAAQIRELAKDGAARKDIAERIGLHPTQVSRIIRGEKWRHVPGAIPADVRFGATHMNTERTCECGRKIIGPSFFSHRKKCRAVGLLKEAT